MKERGCYTDGDFNAKIGSNNTSHERLMGRHGRLDQMNENGELFANFWAENNIEVQYSYIKECTRLPAFPLTKLLISRSIT